MSTKEAMLMDVLRDGERLKMDDGSVWLISPGDIPTVCTWIPTATIRIQSHDKDDMFPFTLTHVAIDVSVRARKIK